MNNLTLDEAITAFEANKSFETAEQLHFTAREYFNDGMIEEDEYDDWYSQCLPYLNGPI
jgi:hypothetical protein